MKTLKILAALAAFAFVSTAYTSATDKPADTTKAACCAKAVADGKDCSHACCVEAAGAGKNCEKCGGKNTKKS
jgi:hypothetical protein